MKILYGINTNGQGHINRARIFIEQLLKDGHDVHVLFSGKEPPSYAYEIAPKTIFKPGPIDFYKNNKVDVNKTLQINLGNISEYAKARRELIELDAMENFDVIFTDFEPNTSAVGRKLGKPVICIDRQHAIFHPAIETAPGKGYEKIGLRVVQNIMLPYYNHCFALDFTQNIETTDDITLFPLVWKNEFDDYDISIENHYLCYLSHIEQDELIEVFSQFPNDNFYIYGFNEDRIVDNVVFKKTSRKGFLTDLTTCKAVIGNSGFNLSWEVCLIGKLIWTIPLTNQFEQVTNAYRLQNLNQGYSTSVFNIDNLKSFLIWAKQKNFQNDVKLTIKQPSDLLALVYEYLEEFDRENFQKPRQIRKGIKSNVSRWRLKQEIKREVNLDKVNQ